MNRTALRHALIDRDLTLVHLARLAGLSYDRVIRIVNGYRPVRDHELQAIARALAVPASTLLGPAGDEVQVD